LAEVQVSFDFDERLSPVLFPVVRMAYGCPSTDNVIGAIRSLVARNRTLKSLGPDIVPPSLWQEPRRASMTTDNVTSRRALGRMAWGAERRAQSALMKT